MNIVDKLAESRIIEAMASGDFDDLPGQGLPLELEDFSDIPEDQRMAYKILKNAGVVPSEIGLRNEIFQLEQSLDTEQDNNTRKQTMKRLQYLFIYLGVSAKKNSNLSLEQSYYEKLLGLLSRVS